MRDETTTRGLGRQGAGDEGPSLKQRALLALARVAVWCVLALVLVWGVGYAFRSLQDVFLVRNPHFVLRKVEVKVTGTLRPEDIVRRLEGWNVKAGKSNLYELDIPLLRERLMKFVLISQADFHLKLPGTLVVEVTERVPMARIAGGRLLDADGWILPEVGQSAAKLEALPVIFNLKGALQVPTGRRAEDEISLAVIGFLRLVGTRPYGRLFDVRAIQCDPEQKKLRIHLRVRNTFVEGAQVIVPAGSDVEIDAALLRVEKIAGLRIQAQQLTRSIDATYQINVPVVGEGPSETPPAGGTALDAGNTSGGALGVSATTSAGVATTGTGAGIVKPPVKSPAKPLVKPAVKPVIKPATVKKPASSTTKPATVKKSTRKKPLHPVSGGGQ